MKVVKSKRVASRSWGLILPCSWESYMQIVYKVKTLAKYYYWIRHDRDFYGDAPEDAENPHAVGELKKPHIHLLFTFNSSRDLSTVQNYFSEFNELKENSYEIIRNVHGAKRYLIHADNPEKEQYKIEEVETNDKLFKNVFVEKASNEDLIDLMRDGLMQERSLTFNDYLSRFRPFISQMTNSYQIGVFMLNLIREWRFNSYDGGSYKY
jgi:hypothetical protein